MAYFRSYDPAHGEEKAAFGDFMPSSPFGGQDVVNVAFDGDVMSVALASSSSVSALKGILYEQTFVPPSQQSLYACMGSSPLELSDYEEIGMVPTSMPLSMVMAGDTPSC
jgi:hypothetical protein